VLDHANKMGAWYLRDADHHYMTMRRRQIEGLDYPEELFDDVVDRMADGNNDSEVESRESEDSSSDDNTEEDSGKNMFGEETSDEESKDGEDIENNDYERK